ncbi:MAG: cyanophycin synthetase [Planctomycetota bacterium]
MQILDTSVFIGPNLYANFPVVRMVIDLGHLEAWPSARLGSDFIDGLLDKLPGLHEHGCSYREPGGFVRRMREDEGTWLGHIFEHVTIELQNVAGADVTFGKTRSADRPGVYDVVYEFEEQDVGLEAGKLAMTLLQSLLPAELRDSGAVPADFDFDEERDSFIRYAQRRSLGPSTASLVKAAQERDIPFLRLNRYSLVQFGHGRFQRRIQATVTSETRHIAVEIASDKEETNTILRDLGLPVPRQQLVHSEGGAVRAARRIKYPVVVKPLDANHGRGVSINLNDDEAVATGFTAARKHARTIIVESYIEGLDHRLLVVNGQLVAASKRVPGHVVGDGKQSIAQLVEETNRDPRRGVGHEKVLTRLEIDHQAERLLRQLGYSDSTVPPKDEVVYLRSTGNLSTGGTAEDVTDIIHPDVREMAERAALAVGLDVAGIDYLTTDISESFKVTGGAICEVNAAPGFRMHVAPSEGSPRDVAGPVIEMLFPPGSPARIPIAAITGTNGKTTTSRMLAHIFKLGGSTVGMTSTDGVYINGRRSVEGDLTGPLAARMVLRDPMVDAAVLEVARGGLLKRGLGFRRSNVAACLNVTADHLGLRGIDTVDQLAAVKRIVVETARDTAVLNADDEHCLKMADYTEAENICYVTLNPANALVKEHIQAGGRAVVLEEGMKGHMITIYDSHTHIPLLWTHLIPATLDGRALHNVQNAMFAAGIAFSMNRGLEDIRHGLRTFDTTYFQAPGRLNVFDEHPFKVILDYGHNPAAVDAMCQLVSRLDVAGKRICVLAVPGDRRDEDVVEIARLAAPHFDRFICRRDDSLRGRDAEEIPRMLEDALLERGVDGSAITVIPDEVEAVNNALNRADVGDLILIFGDDIQRCWNQISEFDSEAIGGGEKGAAPTALPDLTALAESATPGSLIRDDRGVRVARDSDD